MKRIFAFALAVLMLFVFSACGKDKEGESPDIDLEYYADLGNIPEVEYSLGTNPDTITDALEAILNQEAPDDSSANHYHDDFYYNVSKKDGYVCIDDGMTQYFYKQNKKDKGISYMVTYDTAYGFKNGTISIELLDSLKGLKYTEETANEDNCFFLSGISDGSVLTYEFNDRVIMFVFESNALFATAIYDKNNW